MKTIKTETKCEVVVKKSRFIANIFKVNKVEEAEEKIKEISKKYHDARHNCYAYIVENYEKSSDDGEPSKTAGAPMLDIIKRKELKNVLITVTRYFGGILLGTGGLVRAYSEATKNVIELAGETNITKGISYYVEISYEKQKDILYWCNKLKINIINTEYGNNILLTLESTKQAKEELLKNIEIIGNCIIKNEDIYIEEKEL